MIKDVVLVGIGSGIGGICRYLISLIMTQARNGFLLRSIYTIFMSFAEPQYQSTFISVSFFCRRRK